MPLNERCHQAVVRAGIFHNKEVYGIMQGYEGMIEGDFVKLGARSVGNILQRGGTILKTARSEEFKTKEGRKKAFEALSKSGIDALIAIGGDGTFTGLHALYNEHKLPSLCIPEPLTTTLPEPIIPLVLIPPRILLLKLLIRSGYCPFAQPVVFY